MSQEINDDFLNMVFDIRAACGDLSPEELADRLLLAWLFAAADARAEALSLPKGFPTARARQVEQLRAVASVISASEPDYEGKRLLDEEDYHRLLRHSFQQLADAGLIGGDMKGRDMRREPTTSTQNAGGSNRFARFTLAVAAVVATNALP
jgi:hypothetical protein